MNDLFAEIVDGVILLKIIDLLRPGMVNNKKISLQTSSRFKKVDSTVCCDVMMMMTVVVITVVVVVGDDGGSYSAYGVV